MNKLSTRKVTRFAQCYSYLPISGKARIQTQAHVTPSSSSSCSTQAIAGLHDMMNPADGEGSPGELMLQSVPFLPHKSGNQAKKPGPEKEVLTGVSSLFRGPETQQGSFREGPWMGQGAQGHCHESQCAFGRCKESFLLSRLHTAGPFQVYTQEN